MLLFLPSLQTSTSDYIEKSTPQDEDPFFTPEEYATLAQEALVEGRHKKRDPGLVDQLHVVGKDDNKPFDTTSENDTESHQLLHAERQPIAENIISLMTTDGVSSEGILQLGERLKGSHGKALVVVHPYFQEFNVRTSTEDMYKEYLQNLLDEVRDSQEQEIPLVLLECFYNADKMQEILNRIGMTDREVYLVQTEAYSPQPKNGVPLVALASLLHASGLEEAKVIGTLYWEREISGKYKVDRYGGCAGETRERLTDAGVRATVGRAVLAAL